MCKGILDPSLLLTAGLEERESVSIQWRLDFDVLNEILDIY